MNGRCAWCLESSNALTPVVNRNPVSTHDFDFVCPPCAEVERFEHADETLSDVTLSIPVRYRAGMTNGHHHEWCA